MAAPLAALPCFIKPLSSHGKRSLFFTITAMLVIFTVFALHCPVAFPLGAGPSLPPPAASDTQWRLLVFRQMFDSNRGR